MPYTVQQESGYDIVRLTGDIDLSCSPQARKTILASLSRGHHTLVDLSGVSYIDSSGVASLVEGFQSARKQTLRFGLIGVSEAAMSWRASTKSSPSTPILPRASRPMAEASPRLLAAALERLGRVCVDVVEEFGYYLALCVECVYWLVLGWGTAPAGALVGGCATDCRHWSRRAAHHFSCCRSPSA